MVTLERIEHNVGNGETMRRQWWWFLKAYEQEMISSTDLVVG